MNTQEFLEALFESADESLFAHLWTLPDKKTYSFSVSDLDAMAEKAIQLSEEDKEVYVCVGLTDSPLPSGSRTSRANVTAIPGLWADIDIRHDAHKSKNLPETIEEAKAIIPPQFPPSLLVHSGHGLQVWWVYREPDAPDGLCERLQAVMRGKATLHGWTLDATHDAARVLRVPGTVNHKSKPVPVQVLEKSDIRYNPEDFDDILPEVKQAAPSVEAHDFERLPTDGVVADIVANCEFIRQFVENVKEQDEPHCMAAYSNLMRARDGEAFCWGLCQEGFGEKFNEKQTGERLGHYMDCAPISCDYIKEKLGGPCEGCRRYEMKNPASWALSTFGQSLSWCREIEKVTDEMVEDAICRAKLSYVMRQNIAEWDNEIKKKFKGNLRRFQNFSKSDRAEEIKQKFDVFDGSREATAPKLEPAAIQANNFVSEVFPGLTPNLMVPPGFTFKSTGIRKASRDGDPVLVTSTPVIISRNLVNIDTDTHGIEIKFFKDGYWHTITAARSAIFDSSSLIKFADRGLNVSSSTAKYLIDWLTSLDGQAVIPTQETIIRYGWHGDEFLLPGCGKPIDENEDGGMGKTTEPAGDFAEWMAVYQSCQQYLSVRLAIACAFAAPLLKIFGQRTIWVHFWGKSGRGKSASGKLGLSVWRSTKAMKTFNATKNALERAAKYSSDLLLMIDELQMKSKFLDVDDLVYTLVNEQGKERATRQGLQNTDFWRTIILSTGEQQLAEYASGQGMRARTLEVQLPEDMPLSEALHLHNFVPDNHGTAGQHYIAWMQENNGWELARDIHREITGHLKDQLQEVYVVHRDSLACLLTADALASIILLGLERGEAVKGALEELAPKILECLPGDDDIDDASRAWEFVQEWISSESKHFGTAGASSLLSPEYGFTKGGYMYIYRSHLEVALKGKEFASKILKELADEGKLIKSGNGKMTWSQRRNGSVSRMLKFKISQQDEIPFGLPDGM